MKTQWVTEGTGDKVESVLEEGLIACLNTGSKPRLPLQYHVVPCTACEHGEPHNTIVCVLPSRLVGKATNLKLIAGDWSNDDTARLCSPVFEVS